MGNRFMFKRLARNSRCLCFRSAMKQASPVRYSPAKGLLAPKHCPIPFGQPQHSWKQRTTVRVHAAKKPAQGAKPSKKSNSPAVPNLTEEDKDAENFKLDSLNPYSMGRKSRAVFDEVWQQFSALASPTRSISLEEELGVTEFEAPRAGGTTVLVVGATGRVGRVLVRKLLLRGYKVKALVRKREGVDGRLESIPQSVQVVFGNVADYESCELAVKGVDKVIFCSRATTTLTVDLKRTEETGVFSLAKAFSDHISRDSIKDRVRLAKSNGNADALGASKFSRTSRLSKRLVADFEMLRYRNSWAVTQVGAVGGNGKSVAADSAALEPVEDTGNLAFRGAVYSRGGIAEVGSLLNMMGGETLAGSEGLVVRLRGDDHYYSLVLYVGGSGREKEYSARFMAKSGFANIRLPFSVFRPTDPAAPPLDPYRVRRVAVRFELRGQGPAPVRNYRDDPLTEDDDTPEYSVNRFSLELQWIKALPGGDESDFVHVSCAGTAPPGETEEEAEVRARVVAAKRRGEALVKQSGLGYTVVRPGPLMEEPGGYKALVFDQGERITQGISCADVADVCLKALHDQSARNKTFEVCYEYTPAAGLEMYELVAHLPDKSNNYLTPALAPLEKNT